MKEVFADLDFRNRTALAVGEPNGAVLDVGGFESAPYIHARRGYAVPFFSVNIRSGPQGEHPSVRGDIRTRIFEATSFDLVLLVDVLEHIPAADRALALKWAIEYARRRVVVTYPYWSSDNDDAETRLRAHMLESGYPPKAAFEEHREFGLPLADELDSLTSALPIRCSKRFFTSRPVLFRLLHEQILFGRRPDDRTFLNRMSSSLHRADLTLMPEDAYRVLYVLDHI